MYILSVGKLLKFELAETQAGQGKNEDLEAIRTTWLGEVDSNHHKQIQSLLSYH